MARHRAFQPTLLACHPGLLAAASSPVREVDGQGTIRVAGSQAWTWEAALPATRAERREQARALRAQGLSIPRIADRLGVSQFTVKADLTGYVRPSRRDQPTRRGQPPSTRGQLAFGHAPIPASAAPDRDLSTPQRCTCQAAPFCRGPASDDWLGCDLRCRACRPPRRRRAGKAGSEALDAE